MERPVSGSAHMLAGLALVGVRAAGATTIAAALGAMATDVITHSAEEVWFVGGRSFSSDIKPAFPSGVLTPEDTPATFSATCSTDATAQFFAGCPSSCTSVGA